MKLRQKTLFIIGLTLFLLTGALYAICAAILLTNLKRAETQDIQQAVRGVLSVVAQTEEEFGNRFADWSSWDYSYAFVQNRNQEFIQTNLNPESLINIGVNVLVYVHTSGRIIFASGVDSNTNKLIPVPKELLAKVQSGDRLLLRHHPAASHSPVQNISGLLLLPEGAMLITARPILNSKGEGPVRGTLIFGRYLNDAKIQALSRLTRLDLTISPLNAPNHNPNLPPNWRSLVTKLRSSRSAHSTEAAAQLSTDRIVVQPLSRTAIAGYALLQDIYGKPALLLRVETQREIYQQGLLSLVYLGGSLGAMGLAVMGVNILLMERFVLSRLSKLITSVEQIGRSGDLKQRVELEDKDELFNLASAINQMLVALDHTQDAQQTSQQRLHRQTQTLLELAKSDIINGVNFQLAVQQITELSAHTLNTEWVSVWLYEDPGKRLTCADRFSRSTNQHSNNEEILFSEYPVYFQALELERVIVVHDVMHDPRMVELCHPYMSSLGIGATLEAPIRVGGEMIGIICYEHQGGCREWMADEQTFAASIADLVGSALEAQERQRAEAKLQQTTAYLEAIIDNLADGLLVVDPGDRVNYINPALARLFKLRMGQALGKPCDQVFGAAMVDLVRRTHASPRAVFTAEIPLPGDRIGQAVATAISDAPVDRATSQRTVTEDGSIPPEPFSGSLTGQSPVSRHLRPTDKPAIALGCVILIRDITSEKELDQMKTDFVSNVSHELRTPLTSILGFAKMIEKRLTETLIPQITSDTPKVQRAVQQVQGNLGIIVAESQRLTSLINDLLDIAKMEAGATEWRMEAIAITDVLEQAIAATSTLLEQKKLELVREFEPQLPAIVGDQHRLVQVVVNLLSNAIKFTDQGHICCRARLGDGEIVVSVIDSGSGIAKADQDKVFEKFKQVGDTLTEKPHGTGLGLPICRQIIEAHNGRIWVESELGKGSTFSFTVNLLANQTHG